jgi:hypothetical protein
MLLMLDLVCPACERESIDTLVKRGDAYPSCAGCGTPLVRLWARPAAVHGDDIPGGLLIEHGLCEADGTPRKFYSRSEIRAACAAKGLTPWTDLYEESSTKTGRAYLDYMRSGEYRRLKAQRREERMERQLERARR